MAVFRMISDIRLSNAKQNDVVGRLGRTRYFYVTIDGNNTLQLVHSCNDWLGAFSQS